MVGEAVNAGAGTDKRRKSVAREGRRRARGPASSIGSGVGGRSSSGGSSGSGGTGRRRSLSQEASMGAGPYTSVRRTAGMGGSSSWRGYLPPMQVLARFWGKHYFLLRGFILAVLAVSTRKIAWGLCWILLSSAVL